MTLELSKIFVGGVPFEMDAHQLADRFREFGPIVHAKVVRDFSSGVSRGFGFVEFETAESANRAMEAMDGADLGGRVCKVSIARDRPGFGPRGREWNHASTDRLRGRNEYSAVMDGDAFARTGRLPATTGILGDQSANRTVRETVVIRESRRPTGPDATRRRVERRRIPE